MEVTSGVLTAMGGSAVRSDSRIGVMPAEPATYATDPSGLIAIAVAPATGMGVPTNPSDTRTGTTLPCATTYAALPSGVIATALWACPANDGPDTDPVALE